MMMRTQWIFIALFLLLGAAQSALAANVLFLVRVGTDAEGNPAFRAADSRDTYLGGLYDLTINSRAMHEAARYYESLQRDKLAASLQGRGLSQADIQYALSSFQPDPVYIEVNNNRAGAYNDWKGRFSIVGASGQATTVTTPRVVLPLNSDVVRSGDRGLIEQTLVHELAHGAQCKGHGANYLPDTPWLSRPHSGGSVTDEKLAYIEGWAEFLGAFFTGRRTIAEDPANALDANWYSRRADGGWKPPADLWRTEGWNATVLYKVATEAKDANAMWKMTQVMSRTRSQSTRELLTYTAQYFPELAGTIDRVVHTASGGQIPGVTGAMVAQGASRVGRLEQALSGGPPQSYAAYQEYANYQRGQASRATANPGSLAADTRQLEQLYQAKRAQLDGVPWWKFWEMSKIRNELATIEDLYARQLDLDSAQRGAYAAQPAATPPQAAATVPAAGAAAPARKTYSSVVDSLRSGDTTAAASSLDAYRRAAEQRRALRANPAAPRSER